MQVSRMRTRWTLSWASLMFLSAALVVPAAQAADAVPAPKAKLLRVTLDPSKIVLAGARSKQGLRVTGEYSDGTFHDLTEQSQFRTANKAVADVSAEGLIQPHANGSATMTAAVGGMEVSSSLTITRFEDASYNFKTDVLPVISRIGCNEMGCHGSPKGKKRLALSLFSANPHADYLQITDAKKKLLDPEDPENSWFLLKAIGDEEHGGDDRTDTEAPEFALLADWIKNKHPEGTETRKLVRIEVLPKSRIWTPGNKLRLLVEAYYSDGTMRDVTELSHFKSNEEAAATVDNMGRSEASGFGEAIVMVSYGGHLGTSRLTAAQLADVPFPDVVTNNRIDELMLAKLRKLNIIPSGLSTDAEFVRRIYLDVLGVLPTIKEAKAFLADKNPEKRKLLIDALLERPEHADFFALKWGDILQINRNNPARLQDKGMWAYYRWVWDSLYENKPMDAFVHELLTARGSAYRVGPANFFRVGEGAQGMAEQASTVFLGMRLDCAHCHNHPFERFKLADNLGMASFFSRVRIKRTQEFDEEVIYLTDSATIRNPETNTNVTPKFLGGVELYAEKLAADAATAETVAAQKIAAAKAKTLQTAAAKANATKATTAKAVAKAAATAKTTAAAFATVKAAADKALAEKTAADKAVTEKATAAKAAADKAASAKAAIAAANAENAAAAKAAADKAAAEAKKANAAKVAAEALAAKKATAHKTAAAKAASAKAAADKANVAKVAAEQTAAKAATAAQVVLDKLNAEKTGADKVVAAHALVAKQLAEKAALVKTSDDPREDLAKWIASPENPYFARHMANRVWCWLLGRGIVHEPDDFRSTNPPSNVELLDYLGEEFVKSGYDMRHIFRIVLNSRTYQLSSTPNKWNKEDRIHFSYYRLKRLSAEQLADAISNITGVQQKYSGLPLGTRATQLPDISMRSEFLDLFGRPKRATPVESERTSVTHIGQSLEMISSEYLAGKLRSNSGWAAKLASSSMSPEEVLDEVYLASISRYPTQQEKDVILAEPITAEKRREKFEDLLWVLLNTKEFLFNH